MREREGVLEMRQAMQRLSKMLAVAVVGGFLLSAVPGASAGQVRRRVIVVEPFYPYGYYYSPWGYGYPYGPYYANYGDVKIETHRKDLSVYIDGGYAAEIRKDKKFTLRPGNHQIELRNSEGQTVFEEKVAVTVGKTTKLQVS
jgi:hypothetical protein